MKTRDRILVLDDEAGVRLALHGFLDAHGFEVFEAERCEEAAVIFRRTRPDALVLDYLLPDGDALELMPKIREVDAEVPIIVLTAHGSIDLAVRAVKQGAEHFFTKPVELPALLVALQRAIENQRTRRREAADRSGRGRRALDPFLGTSRVIHELEENARKLLPSDRPILVYGETGAGKGVVARWLHDGGPRSKAAFVDLNCAGLSREFLESELFGHEKGAYTGADARKAGLLEVAHRGTLFLDEIGDVDLAVQAKLLKVIEEMRFRRLGDVRDILVDVRFIAATHHNLADLVRQKQFRTDLYFRITALPLQVPPLRERPEDIPILAEHLLGRIGEELGRGDVRLAPGTVSALQRYSWPGNIRELRNVLERGLLLCEGRELTLRELTFDHAISGAAGESPEPALTLAEVERRHILRVLETVAGSVPEAAKRLGIPRSTLYQRIKSYGLSERAPT